MVEPQGEKRKEMETDFEDNIRSLQTQAKNLGLTNAEVLDIRGWKTSTEEGAKMTEKINKDRPLMIIGGMSGSSFSKLRNLQKFSDGDDVKDRA